MSAAPRGLTIEAARELLRKAGLKRTACRVGVLQYLAERKAPVSHAEAAEALVPAGFDKSTVYRVLVELAEAGLATRFDLGDHGWRFELRGAEPRRSSASGGRLHPHFICVDCGQIACLPGVQVRFPPGKPGAPGEITEVLLKGHCAGCC